MASEEKYKYHMYPYWWEMQNKVKRDQMRQDFMKKHAKNNFKVYDKGPRMTMEEYNSIAGPEDLERITTEKGYPIAGGEGSWLGEGMGIPYFKEKGYSTYGDWWRAYPVEIQNELVRRMNLTNDMSYVGLGNGGDWDGADLETTLRMRGIAYPKNAQYWNNYADMVRENNMRVGLNKLSTGMWEDNGYSLKEAAKEFSNPNELYASDKFKNIVYDREMANVEKQLDMVYPQRLDNAYRQMLEANKLAKQEEYDNIRQDAFDGYLVD